MTRFIPPVLTALTGLVVCSWRITHRQLWRDEYATWWAASMPFEALPRLLSNVDAVIAPYYLLMRGVLVVAGESALALRLPSAIAIAAACALLCQLGARMFSARIGFYAALLFAIVPGVSRFAQEARPYAFVLAACVGSSLLLLRALERPTWQRLLAYAAGLVALGALHLVALCVLGAHLLLVLWSGLDSGAGARPSTSPSRAEPSRVNRRVLFGFALSLLGALLVLAPLVYLGRAQVGQISWTLTREATFSELPRMLALSPVVGKMLFALACPALLRLDRYRLFLATWAVLPPLFLYVSHAWLHLFIHRYLLFVLPAWCLLAALTLDDLGRLAARLPRMRLAPRLLPLLGVVVLLAVGRRAHARARSDALGASDYRSVAQVIEREAKQDDGIAFARGGGCGGWARLAMQYALPKRALPRDVFLTKSPSDAGSFGGEECMDFASCLPPELERLWLVTCGQDPDVIGHFYGSRSEVLRREFTIARLHPFRNITIARLDRKPRQ